MTDVVRIAQALITAAKRLLTNPIPKDIQAAVKYINAKSGATKRPYFGRMTVAEASGVGLTVSLAFTVQNPNALSVERLRLWKTALKNSHNMVRALKADFGDTLGVTPIRREEQSGFVLELKLPTSRYKDFVKSAFKLSSHIRKASEALKQLMV